MAEFENRERRMAGINACLAQYGMSSLEEAREVCLAKGVDVEKIVKVFNQLHLKTQFGLTL